jgi:hypothetical protein
MVIAEVFLEHVLVVDLLVTHWTVHPCRLVMHLTLVELHCVLVLEELPTDRTPYVPADARMRFGYVLSHSFIPCAGLTTYGTFTRALCIELL